MNKILHDYVSYLGSYVPSPAANNRWIIYIFQVALVLIQAMSIWPFGTNSILAQGCFNSDFETGNLDGYETYTGIINQDGRVVINNPGVDTSRHKIFHITQGFDPIAATFCEVHNRIPVVPNGVGQFAMRLGNSHSGGQAERVVLNLHVTEDLTFFLLRYAVILNDPGHEDFEQPRFELRILDQQGKIFPCGLYQVRAGENIPGFENCGNWRVRPWTTAGIELKSFLGQDIQIEILTADCALGRHAGYAYIDATCQPLNIKLEGYCPGNIAARMAVTQGFAKYKWNTGDTSYYVDIINPVESTLYSVTVTSATGCQLVLSDTIPKLTLPPQPQFDEFQSAAVCADENFWIHPKGKNLGDTYRLDLGYQADSFLVRPHESTEYYFASSDKYNCRSDTMVYKVLVHNTSITATIDSVSCFNGRDGSISLHDNPKAPFISQKWSDGQVGMEISDLRAGEYFVVIEDSIGCELIQKFKVSHPFPLKLHFDIDNVSCFGAADGYLNAIAKGGIPPYEFRWESSDSSGSSLHNLSEGWYHIYAEDNNSCFLKDSVAIREPDLLEVSLVQDSVSCAGNNDGKIYSTVKGGTQPYSYLWNDPSVQRTATANNLKSGSYQLVIKDNNDCVTNDQIEVKEPVPLTIALIQDSVSCHGGNDGKATVLVSGGSPEHQIEWISSPDQNGFFAIDLKAGRQKVRVTDANHCISTGEIDILQPSPLTITPVAYLLPDCNSNLGARTIIKANGGNGNYDYLWETGDITDTVESYDTGMKWIEIEDDKGCALLDSAKLIGPELNVGVDGLISDFGYSESFICIGDPVKLSLSASRPIDSIKWSVPFSLICDSCPETSGYPDHTFTYTVSAVDTTGCRIEAQAEILVVDDCGTYIPNVFTPNGDGENDHFYVVASTHASKIKNFQVFNRWGNLMFHRKDLEVGNPYDGWDGRTATGMASVGVYVYIIEISFKDMDRPVVFKGDVLLKN